MHCVGNSLQRYAFSYPVVSIFVQPVLRRLVSRKYTRGDTISTCHPFLAKGLRERHTKGVAFLNT
jgi:hypothetical protein